MSNWEKNQHRANASNNAEYLSRSINSAAHQINHGNDIHVHERYVQELRMKIVDATTDRQEMAYRELLQEENQRWQALIAKRKRKQIIIVFVTIILIILSAVVALYYIGSSTDSSTRVPTVNNQTAPIENKVTHSSSIDDFPTEKDNISSTKSQYIDTTSLEEPQIKAWVAFTIGNTGFSEPYRMDVTLNPDNHLVYVGLHATNLQTDTINVYRVTANGVLESLDYDNYPNGYKIASTQYPIINQQKLTENQVKAWVVAVQDEVFIKDDVSLSDIVYDMTIYEEDNLVYARTYDKYSTNEFNLYRVSAEGELEIKVGNTFVTISKDYMDVSTVSTTIEEDFPVFETQKIILNDVAGGTLEHAVAYLESNGLIVIKKPSSNDKSISDYSNWVLSMNPPAGSQVTKGSVVTLTVDNMTYD